MLNKINFRFIDGYIVFDDSLIKRKIIPIAQVKLGEEQFADRSDKALHARLNFKRAVSKIIIRLQAYKFNEQIIRNQISRQSLKSFAPLVKDIIDEDFDYCGESYYDEDDSEGLETLQEDLSLNESSHT